MMGAWRHYEGDWNPLTLVWELVGGGEAWTGLFLSVLLPIKSLGTSGKGDPNAKAIMGNAGSVPTPRSDIGHGKRRGPIPKDREEPNEVPQGHTEI